ncbi:hypothetical protein OG723_44215 (plasmid) [Streptomyces sp. NBC_01278]|uniref:hypothetical protein n=1 Tax=Streptomyces sp. NBC_01278 TaxID=2903809 RepID=UPI002E2EB419|nr:hypothetical protein [Streptomyces sp. NBC_01278]
MPWDSVPWFVEGGAEHSSEITRVLAYAAFGGAEGIIGAGDLKVRGFLAPTASVQVSTGACAITNRAAGATYQSYVARLPTADTVPVAATGITARSDLVVARIENPYSQGENWALPANPKVGPYVYTRIISGVPKTTTDISQVRPGDSAITLARIDLPPNTSTVNSSMITDLRQLVQTRRERRLYPLIPRDSEFAFAENNQWYVWPNAARVNVPIPRWATRCHVVTSIGGLKLFNSYVYCSMQHRFGDLWGGTETYVDDDQGTGTRRTTAIVSATMTIPASMRGTVQPLYLMTYMSNVHTGDLAVDDRSSINHDIEFYTAPDLPFDGFGEARPGGL